MRIRNLMKIKYILYSTITLLLSVIFLGSNAQSYPSVSDLSLEDIMKGYAWMGTPPDNLEWNINAEEFYFEWNPDNESLINTYKYNLLQDSISKLSIQEKKKRLPSRLLSANKDKSMYVFSNHGKLSLYDTKKDSAHILIELNESINFPFFSNNEELIYFNIGNNLFSYSLNNASILKCTNFVATNSNSKKKEWSNKQEEWLYKDQMILFDVLKENERKSNLREKEKKELQESLPVEIPTENTRISSFGVSKNARYISFLSFKKTEKVQAVDMPQYVTKTGFSEIKKIRTKVGYPYGEVKLGIFNTEKDSFYYADITSLPGIFDHTIYGEKQKTLKNEIARNVYFSKPIWSPKADQAIVNIRSTDNKDRWISIINFENGKLECVDHQHNEAWIGGPGIGWSFSSGTLGWLKDDQSIFFQSEKTGYSQLYSYNIKTNKRKALTKGKFEIYDAFLSNDKEYFYFTSNEIDPGEHHFYKMAVNGGKRIQLTHKKGNNQVFLSPDENNMILRYSYANQPWELFLRKKEGDRWGEYTKLTNSYSKEFNSYDWREPEFIKVTASDGTAIPARIYRPEENKKNHAAIIFVHGAGYLQNAHKWWSQYYHEYMFHNFLVDNGYTILDMDYRASAGYGSKWRTAIYRHMGSLDLSDNVDGATYLIKNEKIDKDRIGIYGGSYGGFITLMAQFTQAGVFKAGAALRPVTDWAHYNHGYTSAILNTPFEDSLAYHRSSPIYFAEGLEDHLLICHGMVDDNVNFQDAVRLSQRLIELQKDNWQLAAFPIEPHGFKEWTSWLDEYKRIYKLFNETLLEN